MVYPTRTLTNKDFSLFQSSWLPFFVIVIEEKKTMIATPGVKRPGKHFLLVTWRFLVEGHSHFILSSRHLDLLWRVLRNRQLLRKDFYREEGLPYKSQKMLLRKWKMTEINMNLISDNLAILEEKEDECPLMKKEHQMRVRKARLPGEAISSEAIWPGRHFLLILNWHIFLLEYVVIHFSFFLLYKPTRYQAFKNFYYHSSFHSFTFLFRNKSATEKSSN